MTQLKQVFFILLFLSISISLLVSCKAKDKVNPKEKISKISSRKVSITFDSCSITIDSSNMYAYSVYSFKNNLFAGYNGNTSTLDLFDLSKKQVLGKTVLKKEGPDGIKGHVLALSVINADSIALLAEYSITIVNLQGKVLKETKINSASLQSVFKKNNFYPFPSLNFSYDSLTNTAFVGNISYDYSQCNKKHFEAPIAGQVNLSNSTVGLLPVYYPEIFADKSFGFLYEYGLCFYNNFNKLVYNFASESTIYDYDLATKELKTFGGESEFCKNQASDMNWNKCADLDLKMRHIIENPHFYKIIYDPYRNLFYRFQTNGLPYQKNAAGVFPTSGQKHQYLTIFDSDFSIIKEIELPDRKYYLDCAFVGAEGLYVSAPPPHNEDLLNFKIFKVQ